MKSRFFLTMALLTALFVLSSLQVKAQETPMTNDDVVKLLKAGLPQSVIVGKIRSSKTKFDTSTAAIISLNTAGVPPDVISAMLETKGGYSESQAPPKITGSTSGPVNESDPALGQISEPGIYVYENGKMLFIEPTVFSGTKYNPLLGIVTYGIAKTKIRAKVRSNAANIQASGPKPVFYFVFNPEYKNSGATMAGASWLGLPATSPNEFMLVRMEVKSGSREAVMGSYSTFGGASTGAEDKDVRDYSFDKIKPGIYKVTPKANLTPGEYCFYYAAQVSGLGISGGKIFDFGISK